MRQRRRGDASYWTHEDDLGLIELLLHLHDRIRLLRILVLDDIVTQDGPVDEALLPTRSAVLGLLLPHVGAELGRELVEDLVKETENDADGVFGVRDDDANERIRRARVRVCGVAVLNDRLALSCRGALGDRSREERHELCDAAGGGGEVSDLVQGAYLVMRENVGRVADSEGELSPETRRASSASHVRLS